jgi:hypothetical protein
VDNLEVAFHNMKSSKTLSDEIAKRAAKLEKLHRLIACRVVVDALAKPRRDGALYQVHIEMQAAGGQMAVTREPHHMKERHVPTDALSTVQNAFDAAEAQVRAFNTKQRAKQRRHRNMRADAGGEMSNYG